MATTTASRTLTVEKAEIRFAEPFRIAGYVFEAMPSVTRAFSPRSVVIDACKRRFFRRLPASVNGESSDG